MNLDGGRARKTARLLEVNIKNHEPTMKKRTILLVCFVNLIGAGGAVAQNEEPNQTAITIIREEMTEKDFQEQVLSNPQMSGAARADSVRTGGNTAIINQSGYSNVSSVEQKGYDNMADQTQAGVDNDLRVEQTGKHNRSYESQTGEHNRKVKIQHSTEAIIEQVMP